MPSTTPAQAARALARRLGATLEVSRSGTFDVTAEAPAGAVWSATGTHDVVSSTWDDAPRAAVWAGIQADLEHGVQPCPARPDCEWCDG